MLKRFVKNNRMVLVSIGLGGLFWLLEAAIHSLIFNKGPYLNQVLHPDLHEAWMRMVVVGLMVVFGTYSQRAINRVRKAEERVKMAYAELEQIFNTAADGMRVIDRDFNVLRVNETFVKMSGVSKERSVGMKCYEVFQGPECHTPECPLIQILKGKERVEKSVEKKTAQGDTIPCILTAVPFRGVDGTLLGIVENFKDISQWLQAQKEKEALQEKLEEALTKALSGFLPICANCKKIRDEKGEWIHLEKYIKEHTQAVPSHGICPECMEKLYPDLEPLSQKDSKSKGQA